MIAIIVFNMKSVLNVDHMDTFFDPLTYVVLIITLNSHTKTW